MLPAKPADQMSVKELAAYIDQSVLKPEFTVEDIKRYTQEGIDFGCATICINPASLPIVAPMVEGTGTGICLVSDFPFGLATTDAKVLLANAYCSAWPIAELDMVSNYGWLRSGLIEDYTADIKAVVDACHAHNVAVKVILETDALTLDQVAEGTRAVVAAGGDFVKSSTGFYTGGPQKGATPEVVATMIEAAAGKTAVKGSGCIRTREHFLQLIDMGIDRMGIGYRSTPEVLNCTPEEAGKL